jgi:sulfur relay (sulfurtransferase) DsrC/TusE family protein
MQAQANGKTIELSEAGWLVNLDEWSEASRSRSPTTKGFLN